ncbi:MAG: hypothetical protein R3Y11_08390 [Pseudomonadota bacterium]
MLDTIAHSKLRPAQYMADMDAFREACGGALTGTYHCVLPMGTTVIFDMTTGELFNGEGVVIGGQEHLHEEFRLLCQELMAAGEAAAQARPYAMPLAFEGVLLRSKDGMGYFQIVDMHHESLSLWQQINVLNDLFSVLEKRIPHLRYSQHNPTSALKSAGQVKRWLAPWRKPGIAGVLIKKAEYMAGPCGLGESDMAENHADMSRAACLIRCR